MSRLILNGAELAQKDYVDDAINSIDLSPYATNSYVNNIANQAFNYISNVETQVGVVGEQVTHKQDIMQYNVMPAPSVQNVGQIAQYIGNSGTASVLPEGYQQVEYIQSHGEEYINTGISANSDIKMEVTVLDPDMEDWEDHTLCGGGVAWGDQYLQIQCRQASMCSYGDEWDSVGFQGKSRTTLVQDRNEFSQDGEILYTFPEQTFSTTNNIYLFCAAQSDTPAEFSSFKVASFKVHDNDMLERDFIPCYRESDDEVGLYDIVNDVFYTNEGTGAFEAGPIPQNYTQGYWYKCVNNQGVYSWENIDVQDVPEIELPPTIIINHDGGWSKSIPTSQFSKLATIANYYIKYNSIPNAYYISDAGVYAPIVEITISNSGDFKRFACKTGPSPNASDWGTYYGVTYKGFCSYMAFSFYVTNAEYEAGNIINVYNTTNTSSISRISVDQSNSAILGLSGTNNIPLGTNNNVSYTPTGNYNPATKKYVDDSIPNLSVLPLDISAENQIKTYTYISHSLPYSSYRDSHLNLQLIDSIDDALYFINDMYHSGYSNAQIFIYPDDVIGNRRQLYYPVVVSILNVDFEALKESSSLAYFSFYASFIDLTAWTSNYYFGIENASSSMAFIEYDSANDEFIKTENSYFTSFQGNWAHSKVPTKKYVDDLFSGIDLSKTAKSLNLFDYDLNNPINVSQLEPGVYFLKGWGFNTATIYMQPRAGASVFSTFDIDARNFVYLVIGTKLPEVYDNVSRNVFIYMVGPKMGTYTFTDQGSGFSRQWSLSKESVLTSEAQTITAKKTFTTLPESSVVPTTNNQLVNKKYVDDAIAGLPYDGILPFGFSSNITGSSTGINDNDFKAAASSIITDCYARGVDIPRIAATGTYYNQQMVSLVPTEYIGLPLSSKPTEMVFYYVYKIPTNNNVFATSSVKADVSTIRGSWDGDVFTATYCFTYYGSTDKIYPSKTSADTIQGEWTYTTLPKTTIVPTNDQHFVNKKYVDDSISNKIWIGTQAEYDALGTYSDDTLYFIKEAQQTSY